MLEAGQKSEVRNVNGSHWYNHATTISAVLFVLDLYLPLSLSPARQSRTKVYSGLFTAIISSTNSKILASCLRITTDALRSCTAYPTLLSPSIRGASPPTTQERYECCRLNERHLCSLDHYPLVIILPYTRTALFHFLTVSRSAFRLKVQAS